MVKWNSFQRSESQVHIIIRRTVVLWVFTTPSVLCFDVSEEHIVSVARWPQWCRRMLKGLDVKKIYIGCRRGLGELGQSSYRRVKTGWKWEFEFTLVAVVQCRQLRKHWCNLPVLIALSHFAFRFEKKNTTILFPVLPYPTEYYFVGLFPCFACLSFWEVLRLRFAWGIC